MLRLYLPKAPLTIPGIRAKIHAIEPHAMGSI
jgi:hypothetical protein